MAYKPYNNAEGDKVPGTTTIIGRFKESGGLLQWAYKQGREHEHLSSQGKDGPTHLYDMRDKAGDAGTLAHNMIEANILGNEEFERDPKINDKQVEQAENAFEQYKEWLKNSKIEIIKTEQRYVSEKLQYGGMVDAIGRNSKGEIILLDWKTSNAIYQDYLIQLAAYDMLLEECEPEYSQKGGFHLLRISKDNADFSHHFYSELDDAKKAFMYMRKLYDLDIKLKSRTK